KLRSWNILAFRRRLLGLLMLEHFGVSPKSFLCRSGRSNVSVGHKALRWDEHLAQSQDMTGFSRPAGVSHIPFARFKRRSFFTRKSEYLYFYVIYVNKFHNYKPLQGKTFKT